MAVFYVLPPRPLLGESLAGLLRPYMPGIVFDPEVCASMVETLMRESSNSNETYLIHREDLPDGEDVNTVLCAGYGAEPGDRLVLVTHGSKPDTPRVVMTTIAN